MRLFLDTEFTNFVSAGTCELISIGIVDEAGREFYAERSDYPREACSDFVKETVIPLLGQYPFSFVGVKQRVGEALADWLEEYRNTGCTVGFDYQTDWDLFLDLLYPVCMKRDMRYVSGELIWMDLDHNKIFEYWEQNKVPEHMALYDARANRAGYDRKNAY